MKPTSYLIAISRGGIVEEPALIDALREDRIAGAGLDVTEVEPLPKDSPLWGLPNVVMSPHASALTPQLYEGRGRILTENIRRFLADEPFIYVCDKQAGF
jgi:phosphoglycerate dehydrogenase-like enzyme